MARQLCLLGLAAVVFVTGLKADDFATGQVVDLPDRLIAAGALLAASLGVDLLHYLAGSLVWFAWPRWQEHLREKPSYTPPEHFPDALPRVVNALLVTKLVMASAGWILLLVHLAYSVR